jgi:hypothetical protein
MAKVRRNNRVFLCLRHRTRRFTGSTMTALISEYCPLSYQAMMSPLLWPAIVPPPSLCFVGDIVGSASTRLGPDPQIPSYDSVSRISFTHFLS